MPLKKEGKTEERSSWKKKPTILALYEKEAQSVMAVNILVFQTFFMRIGSNGLSTKAQNQNIVVVAHFSAYFSKCFSLCQHLFFCIRERMMWYKNLY